MLWTKMGHHITEQINPIQENIYQVDPWRPFGVFKDQGHPI